MKIEFLDLGKQPLANGFLYKNEIDNEFFYNLSIGIDETTKLVSLMDFVDAPKMFNENYHYRASMSNTMRLHFEKFSKTIPSYFEKEKIKILEIGSNDGVFLKLNPPADTIAVEPCKNFAKETTDMGYFTYNEFWSEELSKEIDKSFGKQDVIYAANCICHIPDLKSTFSAVENLLSDDGMFVFEDPSLLYMVNNNSYDQIYDEHAHIFSVIALSNMLSDVGLEIFKVENLSVHGGSNRIYVKKKNSNSFKIEDSVSYNISLEKILGLDTVEFFIGWAEKIKKSKIELVNLLEKIKKNNKKTICYGASSKSTTVFNYCGINSDLISYVIDTTPEKQGKLTPGTHIEIVSPEIGLNKEVDFAYLGAWNFVDEICKKEAEFLKLGKFITHVPTVKIV